MTISPKNDVDAHDHSGAHDHSVPHGHGHAHGHSHAHGHTHGLSSTRALTIALVLNGSFLLVEAAAGWWTGSLALMSDALHMVSDVAALVLALGAARLAKRTADRAVTYGLRRFETLGALINGLALFAAVAVILYTAVGRLFSGSVEIDGGPVLLVGAVGLAINVGSAIALARSDPGNLNIRGALAHMIADALGSLGAIIAAGLLLLGFGAADAVVSLFIAALVGWGAWAITRESAAVLLQMPPPGFDVTRLLADLRGLEGVAAVHDVHVWTLDGQRAIVTAHLVSDGKIDANRLVEAACEMAHERHDVDHGTFQVEASGSVCGLAACGAH